jgi:hypothetical protein
MEDTTYVYKNLLYSLHLLQHVQMWTADKGRPEGFSRYDGWKDRGVIIG